MTSKGRWNHVRVHLLATPLITPKLHPKTLWSCLIAFPTSLHFLRLRAFTGFLFIYLLISFFIFTTIAVSSFCPLTANKEPMMVALPLLPLARKSPGSSGRNPTTSRPSRLRKDDLCRFYSNSPPPLNLGAVFTKALAAAAAEEYKWKLVKKRKSAIKSGVPAAAGILFGFLSVFIMYKEWLSQKWRDGHRQRQSVTLAAFPLTQELRKT